MYSLKHSTAIDCKWSMFFAWVTLFLYMCSCGSPVQVIQEPQEDCLAYYPFNGDADDESGNGFDGSVSGAALCDDRHGEPYSAYYFDGNQDHIFIDDNGALSFDASKQEYSISCWFRITNMDHNTLLMDRDLGSGNPPYSYEIRVTTGFPLVKINDGENEITLISSTDTNDGDWHMVTMVVNSSEVRLYVDGDLKVSKNNVFGDTSNDQGTNMGRWAGSIYTYYLRGNLDDIRIYNRAISDLEVQGIYSE